MGWFSEIVAGVPAAVVGEVKGQPTTDTKKTPTSDPALAAIQSGSLSPNAMAALGSMTQDKAQPGFTNLNNLISMGTATINAATLAAQRDAYTQRNQLLEAQRKYGITGGVAAAQAAQLQNNSMQSIADARNKAAAQWFQVAGGAISQLGIAKDEKTSAIAQGVLNQVKNQEYKAGTVDELKATMGDDYADWDALKNIEQLSQGDARQLSDLMQMRTQYLGAQDQQAAKTQEQQAAQAKTEDKKEEEHGLLGKLPLVGGIADSIGNALGGIPLVGGIIKSIF